MPSVPTRIWGILNGLVSLCLWLSPNPAFPQSLDDLTALLKQDPEESIPEEDILLLEEVLSEPSGLSPELLMRLTTLSILTGREVQILKSYVHRSNVKEILNDPEISPFLKTLLKLVSEKKGVHPQSFYFNHWMAVSRGLRYRWRGRMEIGSASAGLFLERDPGEERIGDFYSFYYQTMGDMGEWILGDHQLVAGFGLLAGRAYRMAKGFSSLSLLTRAGQGLLPYRSTHEAWSNRGFGWMKSSRFGRLALSLGHNQRMGQIGPHSKVTVSGTGIHNYPTSLIEPALVENLAVVNWEYQGKNGVGGLTVAEQGWNNSVGQQVDFQYGGAYALFQRGGWTVYGEWASGRKGVRAYYAGLSLRKRGFHYSLNRRKYDQGFTGFRSNPFSEWNGQSWNESGLFQGVRFKTGKVGVLMFSDRFVRPNSGFTQTGLEAGIKAEIPMGRMAVDIQWKEETKEKESSPVFSKTATPPSRRRSSWRITCRSNPRGSKRWRWKLQYAGVTTGHTGTPGRGWGLTVIQQSQFFRIQFNWVAVSVPYYENRLYFWELNLPGEMISRMYSEGGQSPAILVTYEGEKGVQVGCRCRFWFPGKRFSGGRLLTAGLYLNIAV